jgi:hypothetical protein
MALPPAAPQITTKRCLKATCLFGPWSEPAHGCQAMTRSDVPCRAPAEDTGIQCCWDDCSGTFRLSEFSDHWRTHAHVDDENRCLWQGCFSTAKVRASRCSAGDIPADVWTARETARVRFAPWLALHLQPMLPRGLHGFAQPPATQGAGRRVSYEPASTWTPALRSLRPSLAEPSGDERARAVLRSCGLTGPHVACLKAANPAQRCLGLANDLVHAVSPHYGVCVKQFFANAWYHICRFSPRRSPNASDVPHSEYRETHVITRIHVLM